MAHKVRIHRLSFNLSREIRWWLTVSLMFGLLLGIGLQPISAAIDAQFGIQAQSAAAQDQRRIAAQKKFEEGETLFEQGASESLRKAVKKYEEALQLWRAIGEREREREREKPLCSTASV